MNSEAAIFPIDYTSASVRTLSWRGPRVVRFSLGVLCSWVALAVPLRAQATRDCDSDSVHTHAGAEARRISSIAVQSAAPARLLGGIAASLHVTTKERIVRSRLLVSVGDLFDASRVSESVRQLRNLRYLADADITVRCDGHGGVALTVTTRDAWSMWPRFALRSQARASAGLEETNLMGTGRTVRLRIRSDAGQLGLGVGLSDPTLFNDRTVGTVSHDTFRHGSGWRASLSSLDRGVFAPWTSEMAVQQTVRQTIGRTAPQSPSDSVRRAFANVMIARRVSFSSAGATYVMLGAEAERVALGAGPELPIIGPASVRRTIVAADFGVHRRSGQFANARWLLASAFDTAGRERARAEVPLGVEYEGVAGYGRDFYSHQPVTHVDAWVGRQWSLGRQNDAASHSTMPAAILSTDAWAAGYLTRGFTDWRAGSVRTAIGVVTPARRGLWTAQISAERLSQPDPDVRGIALTDPVLRAVPNSGRLAETAATGSLERTLRVRQLARGYALNLALFGAGSMRWDTAIGTRSADVSRGDELVSKEPLLAERLWIASVGVGIRLVPALFGRPTIGLEVGIPILHASGISGRPYIGVSIVPPFGSERHRQRRAFSDIP